MWGPVSEKNCPGHIGAHSGLAYVGSARSGAQGRDRRVQESSRLIFTTPT